MDHGNERFTEDELVSKMLKLQEATPLYSEGALCGKLGVNRDYIRKRAKKSAKVRDAREKCEAIRRVAWEDQGIAALKQPPKDFNATVFIWMTRNILGWRNSAPDSGPAKKPGQAGDSLEQQSQIESLVEQTKALVRPREAS